MIALLRDATNTQSKWFLNRRKKNILTEKFKKF